MAVAVREYKEFFRVDTTGQVRRTLVPAVSLLTLGPPMVLYSAALRKFPGSHLMGTLGAALMIAGLVIGFAGIAVMLLEDRFVAVAQDGLVVHLSASNETFFAWDDIASIHAEGAELVLVPKGKDAQRVPFTKKSAQVVAERLDDWRRKSAWNLAPTDRS